CLSDGKHIVRFGFSDQHLSRNYRVVFDTKQPSGSVRYESESPNSKRITGRVIDEGVVDEQNITVEVAFKYQEGLETKYLPVQTYFDSVSGQRMYEFEYCIQNLPQISRDSSAYREPFFALKVKDQAGNAFRHTASYNTFMAEGVQTFQTTSADIIMQRVEQVESPVQETRISVKHQPPPRKNIASGPPPITLRVLIRSPKQVVLSYTRLKPELRSEPEQYVVLKKDQEIGVSYDTTYSDRTVAADSTYHYQVLAKGSDGIYYPSNIATAEPFSEPEPPPAPLRSIPTELSEEQVRKMIVDRKFYDRRYNEKGPGFQNRLETKTLNDDKVVYDHATGLMWQQSGSKEIMNYEDAMMWIAQLNSDEFAGFNDWRLPTLEEAMSLVKPKKNIDDLYIDSTFSSNESTFWRVIYSVMNKNKITQDWIWTADRVKGERWVWIVNFGSGYCCSSILGSEDGLYVRAVRSGRPSVK
ncbi:MAG: DUF1566 domain-containing protein, partial [Candidatus Lokiarchaeota archaeon]|nr:DUF1566 domain-containing protein [Candidatus Lokiarchaeota archaeon]